MKVKVRILRGLSAGKEVNLPTPECLIGRSDECQLRLRSDCVSRRHCLVTVRDGLVWVRDLQSRNGTLLNGRAIKDACQLLSGDVLTVGPVAFEVVIDHALGGDKRSEVHSVREAAARTAQTASGPAQPEESQISLWLDEAEQAVRKRVWVEPDTSQLALDETDQINLQQVIERRAQQIAEARARAKAAGKSAAAESSPVTKPVSGKLPLQPEKPTVDSREAASAMLKRFFNRR